MPNSRGPQVSTYFGSTEVRPYQVGFPAELTSTWDASTGYSWKQLLLSGVAVAAETGPLTGDHAVTPDNDTSLASGTVGWLEPDPQAGGWYFVPMVSSGAGVTSGTALINTPNNPSTSFGDVISLALPSAGNYMLFANMQGNIQASAGATGIVGLSARLHDGTAALPQSVFTVLQTWLNNIAPSGDQISGHNSMHCPYVASGAVTIKLQAAIAVATSSGTYAVSIAGSGDTRLSYLKY